MPEEDLQDVRKESGANSSLIKTGGIPYSKEDEEEEGDEEEDEEEEDEEDEDEEDEDEEDEDEQEDEEEEEEDNEELIFPALGNHRLHGSTVVNSVRFVR